jgi:predicted metalloprotease
MANWNNIGSRGDVDDRRGQVARVGGLGLGTIALVALLNYALTGQVDIAQIANDLEQVQNAQGTPTTQQLSQEELAYREFASTVLGSTNDAWGQAFSAGGQRYISPGFVLFRGATQSACGGAYAQVGPHYCPVDQTVYLDETFFEELRTRFGGSTGDVAQAYVIAHEVGHHVQTLLGIEKESVQHELMADCLAGMWAHSIRSSGVLEPGEIQEALDAASAVGDDNIQRRTSGTVSPESWTHGSSAQRVKAFTIGYEGGDFAKCDAL